MIIGLDVTQQSIFTADYLDALRDDAGSRAASCGMSAASTCASIPSASAWRVPCARSSAIAYVIDPALFTLRRGRCGSSPRPAIGHTPAKFDDTRHPHDDVGRLPGPAGRGRGAGSGLLALYRDTLVAWGKGAPIRPAVSEKRDGGRGHGEAPRWPILANIGLTGGRRNGLVVSAGGDSPDRVVDDAGAGALRPARAGQGGGEAGLWCRRALDPGDPDPAP